MELGEETSEVTALLNLTESASSKFIATVELLGEQGIDQTSQLEGWTCRMVIAHVSYVAEAYLRVTDEALRVGRAATFPGGTAEREVSVSAFDGLSHGEVREKLQHSSSALLERWHNLDPNAWSTSFLDEKLGKIRLVRLVALRLTELEVHESDLIQGHGPSNWNPTFVRVCLPLRIAWLAKHHRQRRDADHTIQGRWLLKASEGSWLVSANGTNVACTAVTDDVEADVTICGDSPDLLAFLLGRSPSSPLSVSGDISLAERFKKAFPGP